MYSYNSNELYHWKYIKRERGPNGKWRYWYDSEQLKKDVNSSLNKAKDALGADEKEAYEEASKQASVARVRKSAENVNVINAYKNLTDTTKSKELRDTHYKKEYEKDVENYLKRDEEYRKAEAKKERTYKEFLNTPIGFISNPVESVKQKLSDIFGRKKRDD